MTPRVVIVPAVIATYGVLEAVGVELGSTVRGPTWANVLLVLAMTAPLLVRVHRPVAAVGGVLLGSAVTVHTLYLGHEAPFVMFLAMVVAAFAAGHGLDRDRLWQPAGLLLVFLATTDLPTLAAGADPADIFPTYAFLLGAAVLGQVLRSRQNEADRQAARVAEVEKERALWELRAVSEERARIARELHDVVTHNVSGMVVHASAERRSVTGDAHSTDETLELIERTGRDTLVELRRLLGVLRAPDGDLSLEPQPRLTMLPALVEDVRRSGTHVSLEMEGDLDRLPAGVQLHGFRIVQEALTNIRRHAPDARARVRVRRAEAEVVVEVTDDGRPVTSRSVGHGLIGMRERVLLHGGDLEAGARPEGGYRVRATFPVEEDGA